MKGKKTILPFAAVALIWAGVSFGLCRYFSTDADALRANLAVLFGLWALCLLDLTALAKVVQGLLFFTSESGENRPIYAIQTFSWLVIKLACLGIFALVMIKGKAIPTPGLMTGLGTLVVVPLVGGLIWCQITGVTQGLGVLENGA